MFASNNLQILIEELKKADNDIKFGYVVKNIQNYLESIGISPECILELHKQSFYLKNDYSDSDNLCRLEEAKSRVLSYIESIMGNRQNDNMLYKILDNFYFFLEALLEGVPDKRGSIKKEQLETIKIKNEYDVQFLLYAYLKPIYPLVRKEVNNDTGYGTVRVDLEVDSDTVVEVKCTRNNMPPKKLIEEVEADMVHYRYKDIFFFIYDKSKIISNPLNFKNTYETKTDNKNIYIIIHQPKIL